MGVKGLTSYVYSKADLYLQDHCLKSCLLIVDGYALACALYYSSGKIMPAFGGDYDKYGKIIQSFFDNLDKCKITPLVICDGGYEKRKVNTIKKRSLRKVFSFRRLSPSSSNLQCFPLHLKHVFREVLLARNVTILQSDYEADSEVAALAKRLDAPVLSNDSDFFIFDVAYIPIQYIHLNNYEKNSQGEYFIPCKIFKLDNLLKGLGGLPKPMLPLLATILGNDYIKSGQFQNFFNQISKSRKIKPGQKHVERVVHWLKNEDFDSALQKILGSLKKHVRKNVRKSIMAVINGYKNLNSPLENYLPLAIQLEYKAVDSLNSITGDFGKLVFDDYDDFNETISEESDQFNKVECDERDTNSELNSLNSISRDKCSDYDKLVSIEISSSSSCETECSENESGSSVEDTDVSAPSDCKASTIPSWILEESRKADLNPTIITLISLRAYFFDPQIEDYTLSHAGTPSLPILQLIMGYLNIDFISCWSRTKYSYVGSQLESIMPQIDLSLPYDFNKLSKPARKEIILNALKIEDEASLLYFPDDWQLYIMSIVYWLKSVEDLNIRPCHIHGLIITLITVNVISSKIGIFWQRKYFMKKYGDRLKLLSNQCPVKPNFSKITSINEIINTLGEDEAISAMNLLLPYFHIDPRLHRHANNFNLKTIHLFAQFQYTFEFALTLNSLFSMVFKRCNLSMFYNGTFLYNFCCNFKGRSDIVSYIENLFHKQPTVVFLYKTIFDSINKVAEIIPRVKIRRSKLHKRKVVEKHVQLVKNVNEQNSEEECFEDVNNKYSILSRL